MTNPTDPAAVKPVAWACEADIRALKYPGDDISLSTEPIPRFGMKMPLYDASYGDLREKAAVERVISLIERAHDDGELIEGMLVRDEFRSWLTDMFAHKEASDGTA